MTGASYTMARKATTLLTGTALLTMAAVLPFSGTAQAAPIYSLPHLSSPVAGTTWTATVSEDKGAPQDLATLLKLDSLTPETSTAATTTEAFTKLVGERSVGDDCASSPVQVTFTAALGGDASKQEVLPLCLTTNGWQVNTKAETSSPDRLSFAPLTSTLTATPPVAPSATAVAPVAVRALAVKAAVAADDPTATATSTDSTEGDDPTDTDTTTPASTDTATPVPNPTSTTTPAPTETTTPAPAPTSSTTEAPNPTHTAPNPTTTQAPPPADASSFNVTGRFYKDLDKSGNFTSGDAPLVGKALSLYNAATNSVVAQVKTDANGYYKFSELPKGSYTLKWTADGAVGTLQQGPTTVGGSNAAVITSYPFDLIDGDITGVDFGMIYSKGGAATTPSTPGKSNSGTYVFPGKTTAPTSPKTTAPSATTPTSTTTTGNLTPSDDSSSASSSTSPTTEAPVRGKVNSGELSSRKNGGLLAWSAGFLALGGLTLGSGLKPARKRSKH